MTVARTTPPTTGISGDRNAPQAHTPTNATPTGPGLRAQAKVAEGRYIDVRSGRQTFARYVCGVWLANHPVEASTREGYAYIIGKHLLPVFGRMRMAEILPGHIRSFLRRLLDTGTSSYTVQRCKTVLGAIFTTALADEIVTIHPCRGIRGPLRPRRPLHILTPTEFDALLAALGHERWQLWAETALETGLRWGELAELRTADLDLEVRTITVARTVLELRSTFHPTGGHFLVKDYPKNHEHRTLRISQPLTARLRTHLTEHRLGPHDLLFSRYPAIHGTVISPPRDTNTTARAEAITESRHRHGTLTAYSLGRCRCPHCRAAYAHYRAARRATGKDRPPIPRGDASQPDPHLSRDWFRNAIWKPALTAAGITRRVRMYDLRHANASWMLAGGADVQTVRERLGHASLRATEYYLTPSPTQTTPPCAPWPPSVTTHLFHQRVRRANMANTAVKSRSTTHEPLRRTIAEGVLTSGNTGGRRRD